MGDADEGPEEARGLLAAGDVPGLLRHLRADGVLLPLEAVAALVAGVGRLVGCDDLVQTAAAVADGGDGSGAEDVKALYDFGCECVDHEIGYLAVGPLARALVLAPDAPQVLGELVTALEQDGQHARAVSVLEEHASVTGWMHRCQYVYNALMAGSPEKAREGFRQLTVPVDAAWIPARERVRHMLARAAVARAAGPLDYQNLRGWHYTLTGGVLACLSPHGFHTGMTGRWGFLADSEQECAFALRRLRLVLDAAGAVPEHVALLPDRSSRILGLAAAAVLGLPAADFNPYKLAARSLVVAYDLNAADPDAVAALHWRAPGQVLFERATCWTHPPRVAADVSGLLGQTVLAPWDGQWCILDDGNVGQGPGDDRPVEVIAAELARTEPERDEGDGTAPADPDDGLRRFVQAVTTEDARDRDGGWLGGLREHVPNAGPVPSSRLI